jgi:hypothetical protein
MQVVYPGAAVWMYTKRAWRQRGLDVFGRSQANVFWKRGQGRRARHGDLRCTSTTGAAGCLTNWRSWRSGNICGVWRGEMGVEKQIRHCTLPRKRSEQAGSQWGNHRNRSDLKLGHHHYVAGCLPAPYLVADQDATIEEERIRGICRQGQGSRLRNRRRAQCLWPESPNRWAENRRGKWIADWPAGRTRWGCRRRRGQSTGRG